MRKRTKDVLSGLIDEVRPKAVPFFRAFDRHSGKPGADLAAAKLEIDERYLRSKWPRLHEFHAPNRAIVSSERIAADNEIDHFLPSLNFGKQPLRSSFIFVATKAPICSIV
ncbi:hypothetical protein XI09_11330 [Bradyrhizobium sp. CCBAU 11386]|nr:hypothetical protein [Bradyrhizobium sp. CCBAU 11386]